jgi:hypothetical protein
MNCFQEGTAEPVPTTEGAVPKTRWRCHQTALPKAVAKVADRSDIPAVGMPSDPVGFL